jgi:hypothetical protein
VWSTGLIELFRDERKDCTWCKREYPERKERIAGTIVKAAHKGKGKKSQESSKHPDSLSFDNLFEEDGAASDKKAGNAKPGALSKWQYIKS